MTALAIFVGLTPDKGERVRGKPERPRRQLAITAPAADTTAEMTSMGRLRGLPPRDTPAAAYPWRPADWSPKAARCWRTATCGCPVGRCLDLPSEREAGPVMAAGVAARYEPYYQPRGITAVGMALVYDDPPDGHEWDAPLDVRPHAVITGREPEPYCARASCADRHGHWTEEHPEPDPLVAELLAARAERIAASGPVPGTLHPAITASLQAAGFTGHVTRQALDDSVIGTITPVQAEADAP